VITVIDSCTWIDAKIYGGVEEAAVAKGFALGAVAGCDQLWNEIRWVLTGKYRWPLNLVSEDLTLFRMFSVDVQVDGSIRGSIDPDDDFILECAVRSKAQCIVSNDLKHLVSLGSFEGIPILTPTQYVLTPYAVDDDEIERDHGRVYGEQR
jgi:predicted nucleic acid-binding protein